MLKELKTGMLLAMKFQNLIPPNPTVTMDSA
jgi:hypothetical protein